MKKFILIAAVVFAAVAAPVQAKGPKSGPDRTPPANSSKCRPVSVAYVASGKLVSGSLAANADGTYSGTIVVHVSRANTHASGDKGTDKTYTLVNAHVNVHGANPASLATGSRVNLQGKVTTLARNCNHAGFTPTVTVASGDVKAPRA